MGEPTDSKRNDDKSPCTVTNFLEIFNDDFNTTEVTNTGSLMQYVIMENSGNIS